MTPEESAAHGGQTQAEIVVGELEPLVREPTASVIARRIRQGITQGLLPPGTQLTEIRLAEQLGVSRAPVREALQRLIQEGLAENRRRGVFVKELSDDDVADVYFARTACELTAIERILNQAMETDWGPLEDAVQNLATAAEDGDWEGATRADRHFHQALVAAANSPRLTRMFDTLIAETAMCLQALENAYADAQHLVNEHREILDSLRSGDHGATVSALKAHMDDAIDRLVSVNSPSTPE